MPANARPPLVRLHRVVIAAAIALAVIFAIYSFRRGETELALGSGAVAIALAFYLRWFSTKPLNQLP